MSGWMGGSISGKTCIFLKKHEISIRSHICCVFIFNQWISVIREHEYSPLRDTEREREIHSYLVSKISLCLCLTGRGFIICSIWSGNNVFLCTLTPIKVHLD